MAPKQTITVRDLTGGLNLRADGFDVAPNESPDMLNVVLDARGGFEMRQGVAPIHNTPIGNAIASMTLFETSSGTKQIVVSDVNGSNSAAFYSTGGNFTSIFAAIGAYGRLGFAQAQDKLYIHSHANACRRWTGSAVTTCGTAFNDTGTPANSGVPQARYGAFHMGRHWVGYTKEGGTDYPSRVRFSYTSNVTNTMGPEDFMTNDYIDIAPGGASGVIVALVPFFDRLFVFKTNGVYEIIGADAASFQVITLSEEIGACGPEAVVATTSGIFFFDYPTGLHAVHADGSSRYLFEKLLPVLQDGTIQGAYQHKIAVGYHARKVWVSVPYGSGVTWNTRTYVLDTAIGGGAKYGLRTPIAEGRTAGAWTQYDFGLGGMAVWAPAGAREKFIGFDSRTVSGNGTQIIQLEDTGVYTDTFLTSSGAEHIDSYYVTSWLDVKDPAVKKHWKRPWFVVNNDATAEVVVEVFKDYYAQAASKSFSLETTGSLDGAQWDVAQWDVDEWSGETAQRNSVKHGGPIGIARAIQMKFIGPINQNVFWGLQGFSIPFIPRRIR